MIINLGYMVIITTKMLRPILPQLAHVANCVVSPQVHHSQLAMWTSCGFSFGPSITVITKQLFRNFFY